MATGTTRFTGALRRAATAISGVSDQLSGSTSTRTSRAPIRRTAVAVAGKVSAGSMTRLPAPIPMAESPSSRAAVPVLTAAPWRSSTENRWATRSTSSLSSCATSDPPFVYQRAWSILSSHGKTSCAEGISGINTGMGGPLRARAIIHEVSAVIAARFTGAGVRITESPNLGEGDHIAHVEPLNRTRLGAPS